MVDQRDDDASGRPRKPGRPDDAGHSDQSSHPGHQLNEHILDVLVYIPAGIVVSVVDELPKLAARGRDRLGVGVSSARAVGTYAVAAGRHEFQRRSEGLLRVAGVRSPARRPAPSAERSAETASAPAPAAPASATSPGPRGPDGPSPLRRSGESSGRNGHVPAVSMLSIPGFDTLSASQVVQRLDGLNRVELVSVRAYEASTRGRRTILNRVDQLLDERS